MENRPVIWFEIYVQDMARAQRFYEAVLQTRLTRMDSGDMEMMSFPADMNGPGAGGALVRMEGVPSGPGGTMVYFYCDDVAVEAGRVEEAGGRLERGKTSLGEYGFMALAFDTEGNMFGLHSMK